MIFLIIALMCLTSAGTLALRVGVENKALKSKEKQVEAIEPKDKIVELSIPSENLKNAFERLPDDHKPDVDMYEICRALDVKFKNTDLNNHFRKYTDNGWDYGYTWMGWHDCVCVRADEPTGEPCPFNEYIVLADQIAELSAAVQEQERVLELAEHQEGLDNAKLLMSILDDSVHVVRSVTSEVSARVESN